MGPVLSQLFRHANAADKSALVAPHGNDLRAETLDERHAFLRHPVRHEDDDLMSQRPANRRKRNPCVAARSFGDSVVRVDAMFLIRLLQDVKRHPVLDAAGKVKMFSFGIDDAVLTKIAQVDGQQRRVADHVL